MAAIPRHLAPFLAEVRRTFARRGEDAAAQVVALLDGLGPPAAVSPVPADQPACALMPAALARATPETAELVARVVDLAPALAWERAPADETPSAYYAGHAYCMIAGDGGFLPAERFMLGLFLIAPGVFYPNHAHAADEVYYVLGGHAEWQTSGGAFEARGPGGLVAMPSMTPHALRTGADPVLILWAWYGDLHGSFVYLPD